MKPVASSYLRFSSPQQEAGLVGRDLSLVSCNYEPSLLSGLYPTPTTIDIHAEVIGRRAVDQLAWRLTHDDAVGLDVGVAPALVAGASVLRL